MARIRAEALGSLVAAAARGGDAARGFGEALQGIKEAMESLDAPRLEGAMAEARRRADSLSVASNALSSLTRLTARAAGLEEGATLLQIGDRVGATTGGPLSSAARDLSGALRDLAVEVAAQGIAARYGAELWAHLLGLRGEAGGYNPSGRLKPGTGTQMHRA